MKRLILWSLVLLVLGVPLALLGAAVLAFEDSAAIVRKAELTPEQTARAKRILQAHDPRKVPAGVLRTFAISAGDLDLALNFLLAQQGGGAKVAVQAGAISFWVSARAPANPFGAFLNVEGVASETAALPSFDRLQVGRLPIPGMVADWILARALDRLNATEVGGAASDTIRGVRMADGHVQVEYVWNAELPDRLRAALLPPADEERLKAHQTRLVEITADARLPRQVSLVSLLIPLMAHAAERGANGDAIAENRAALIVLAFYVNGRGLGAVVPAARHWPRAAPRSITLSGRTDFSQHFTVSAAIAATAGSPLSDAIGVYKEVEDARSGSGFSFTDIAADRAGTVFGQHATRSSDSARVLQTRVVAGTVEADLMPQALDLPEMMTEAEFKRRFGGVGEASYKRVMEEIERRVGRLALYR